MTIWLHIGCARTHKAAGRAEEAATSYRKVLELDPQHREAREHLEPAAERRRGGLMSKWLGRGED
jgi:predicted TPR repeat methyltransferase